MKNYNDKLQVFIAYSREDSIIREDLDKHLTPLKKEGLIDTWYDGLIEIGKEWNNDIIKNLDYSDIILLLISVNFIASDYCYRTEMGRALEKHSKLEAVVIPIIISHCDWKNLPFSKLQVLPRDGEPIKLNNKKDRSLTECVLEIRKMVNKLLSYRKKTLTRYNKHVDELGKIVNEYNERILLRKAKLNQMNSKLMIAKNELKKLEDLNLHFKNLDALQFPILEMKESLNQAIKYTDYEEIDNRPNQIVYKNPGGHYLVGKNEIDELGTLQGKYKDALSLLDNIKTIVQSFKKNIDQIEIWIELNKET